MGMGFSCRKNAFFQAPIKLAQPFPAPELRAKNLTDTTIFLILLARERERESDIFQALVGAGQALEFQVALCLDREILRINGVWGSNKLQKEWFSDSQPQSTA